MEYFHMGIFVMSGVCLIRKYGFQTTAFFSVFQCFSGYRTYWYPHKIERNPLNEPLFYSVGIIKDGFSYFWLYYIGFKKQADQFSYSFKVGDKNRHYVNFFGPVKSIFESYDDILEAKEVFTIGIPALQRLCSKNKLFECMLNIIDKKAEIQDSENDSGVSDE